AIVRRETDADVNLLADGTSVWPVAARRFLIDDHHLGCVRIVMRVEQAAGPQRNAQRPEIIGRDDAHAGAGCVGRVALAAAREAGVGVEADAEWQPEGDGRGLDAWSGREASDQRRRERV